MNKTAILVALLTLPGQTVAHPCSPASMPMPKAEASEIVMRPDSALETTCLNTMRKVFQLAAMHLGKPSFTRHRRWGDIVRWDVGNPTPAPNNYSRVLCSRYHGQQMVQVAVYNVTESSCVGRGWAIGIPAGTLGASSPHH